jgi:hypothetical protein
MQIHSDKSLDNQKQTVGSQKAKNSAESESTFQFVDNRSETVSQRKILDMANSSYKVNQMKTFQTMLDIAAANTIQKQSTQLIGNLMQPANLSKPIQRVPVSNSNMWNLFSEKKGIEWFFWGPGGNHVGAIRPDNGTGEVTDFHVKKEFKGAKTNRIDWLANGETYNEVAPPTKLEYNDEGALKSMRELGEETKNLLIKNKK